MLKIRHLSERRSHGTTKAASQIGVLVGLGAIAMALCAVMLAGCGKQEGQTTDELILANVGDVEIKGAEYKELLARFEADELPRLDGQPIDTGTDAGRLEFLDVIINKEVMQLKAYELGYAEDERVQKAKQQLLQHHGRTVFFDDHLDLSGAEISQEEIDAYAERLGEQRRCRFIVSNFESGAAKAAEAARTGTDWDKIVAEYHEASPDPEGKYEMTIAWGQYDNKFEKYIFEAELGGVTPPIETTWGYWILRVEDIEYGDAPDLEAALPRVRTGLEQRRAAQIQQDLEEQIRVKHNFHFDEEALWIVYKGLPEHQEMMDPETNQPWAQEDLEALNIAEADRDQVLYSFTTREGETVVTVADYKDKFDKMNIFRRPKYSEMLGGLRSKIMKDVNNTMLTDEVTVAGYLEDPRVEELSTNQINEMMVTNLHGDQVVADDYISPEDREAYWAEHKENFRTEEQRICRAIVCETEEGTQQAAVELRSGADFQTVLEKYSTDEANRNNNGQVGPQSKGTDHPIIAPLFALQINEVCDPIEIREQFVILQLVEIKEAGIPDMSTKLDQVDNAVRSWRKDDKLKELLAEWRQEFGVQVFDENLHQMPTWQELKTAAEAAAEAA